MKPHISAVHRGKPTFRKVILYLVDIVLCYLSFAVIRAISYFQEPFEISIPLTALEIFSICAIFTLMSALFRVNGIIWRYATGHEFLYIFAVTLFSTIPASYLMRVAFDSNAPISGYLLASLVSASILSVSRMAYAEYLALKRRKRCPSAGRQRLLIVGAGIAGLRLLEELRDAPDLKLYPVCMVDDDPQKIGRTMYNIRVVGNVEQIPEICRNMRIDVIYIAIPSATAERSAEIMNICLNTDCTVKVLPRVFQLNSEKALLRSIRDITPEELLGREEVSVADESILEFIRGKTVVVTGGGGSIGSEICRQVAAHDPRRLVIIDEYENTAYEIQQELVRTYGTELDLEVYITTVCDYDKLLTLFRLEMPDVVIHAAAHKHVPLMETVPDEAVKNNVFGTYNTILAAREVKVQKMILISTDKAVNPTNVMGATKRICEMLIQYADTVSPDSSFAAVRFGNVLGSHGSVIPLFKKQIENHCDLTVTHPEITRYFMTISEASQLVLTAGAMAKGGEIYVLDMGKPVKIDDLARKMIRLAGLTIGEDINIRYVGLRPGEKLYEELLMSEEGLGQTENRKIFIGQKIPLDYEQFCRQLEELRQVAYDPSASAEQVVQKIQELVPTFRRNQSPKTA